MKLVWNETYSVGVKEIDLQHQKLLNLITKVDDAIEDGMAIFMIIKILDDMTEYAKEHFADEEEYMKKVGFPGLEDQKKMHQEFIREIKVVSNEISSAHAIHAIGEVQHFLYHWWGKHILEEDKKYMNFK